MFLMGRISRSCNEAWLRLLHSGPIRNWPPMGPEKGTRIKFIRGQSTFSSIPVGAGIYFLPRGMRAHSIPKVHCSWAFYSLAPAPVGSWRRERDGNSPQPRHALSKAGRSPSSPLISFADQSESGRGRHAACSVTSPVCGLESKLQKYHDVSIH